MRAGGAGAVGGVGSIDQTLARPCSDLPCYLGPMLVTFFFYMFHIWFAQNDTTSFSNRPAADCALPSGGDHIVLATSSADEALAYSLPAAI